MKDDMTEWLMTIKVFYEASFIAVLFLTASHANVRLQLGKLTPWLTGHQFQRLHHSIEMKHRDKNFAQYFPVFDKLFSTYYKPEKDEFPKTGLAEVASDIYPHKAVIRPFKLWWQSL